MKCDSLESLNFILVLSFQPSTLEAKEATAQNKYTLEICFWSKV